MSNGSLLLVEEKQVFSPISQLNYEYYDEVEKVHQALKDNDVIQCVVGGGGLKPGNSQVPGICDFADGVDTMEFLSEL